MAPVNTKFSSGNLLPARLWSMWLKIRSISAMSCSPRVIRPLVLAASGEIVPIWASIRRLSPGVT